MKKEQYLIEIEKAQRRFIDHTAESAKRLVMIVETVSMSDADYYWLKNLAHQLAGSGETFGFKAISTAASALDYALGQPAEANAKNVGQVLQSVIDEINQLIFSIKSAEEYEVVEPLRFSRGIERYSYGLRVYLLEDDLELASHLASELRLEGFEIDLFTTVDDIDKAVRKKKPVAILADIILEDDEAAGLDWVKQINSDVSPPIPVIFISRRGDFTTRLRAIRTGANFYLQKPVNIPQLSEILHECVHNLPKNPYRVMIIDDDELLAQAYQIELVRQGMSVDIVVDPFVAIDAIERFQPELILLDLYMPGCNGLELGQMIRQWPKYAMIPIIFLSVETDVRKQLEAFKLAGDDFIVKPVQPWQLGLKVHSRVKHARMASYYTYNIANTLDHHEWHNQLSDLPNKRSLEKHLNEVIANSASKKITPLALLWIDIDNFARLNDLIGHKAGDRLIVDVSKRLMAALDPGDFFAHQGGDLFAVVIEGIDQINEIEVICSAIKRGCSEVFTVNDSEYTLSVSIGVSLYPKHCENAHALFKAADLALHDAKNKGRNAYSIYDDSMTHSLTRQILLAGKLRSALQDGEGLFLVYQPKFTVDGKKLIGAEALIRWWDEKLGNISPDEFITVAEQSDLIIEVGDWVIRQCCQQIQQWQLAGMKIPKIALNLSARDFINPGFVSTLVAITHEYGVDPHQLELELTERTIAHHEKPIIKCLNQLTKAGFTIAIDDFGTGYSSLAYLKKLPITLLKIDASFVKNLPEDKDDCAITETIIKLAQVLSVDVLAECVETEEQALFLQQKGCQYVQGYLYAKPLSEKDFVELIARGGKSACIIGS